MLRMYLLHFGRMMENLKIGEPGHQLCHWAERLSDANLKASQQQWYPLPHRYRARESGWRIWL